MPLRSLDSSFFPHVILVASLVSAACVAESATKPPSTQNSNGGSSGNDKGGASNGGSTNTKGGATSSGGTTSPGSGGTSSSGGSSNSSGGTTSNAGAGGSDSGTAGSPGALEQCPGPSIDRLKTWGPTEVDGMTAEPPPTTSSVLVKEGDHYIAKLAFTGTGWGVAQILLHNSAGKAADLSASSGMTVTYSSTAEFYLQMRAKSSWSGGHHYRALFPSTGGEKKTVTMSFEAKNWSQPSWAEALDFGGVKREVLGFTLATEQANSFVFYGFRIDGHVPPCN